MDSIVQKSAIAIAAGALLLAGCTSGSMFRRDTSEDLTSNGDSERGTDFAPIIDVDSLGYYLDAMRRLVESDSLDQAAIFNQARDSAEFAPTRANRLLYALMLSLPGHPGSDPSAAAQRLRDLIAAGDTLLPEERLLAEIQLATASELEVLQAASDTLQEQAARTEAERAADYQRNLESLRAENAALQQELEEAQTMLDAITNIERSLNEREDSDE
jgi:hypothetical protein